jgi:hypothetical protein
MFMQGLWINAASTCTEETLAASNITSRTVEYEKAGMTLQCVSVCHLTQFVVGIQEAPTAVLALGGSILLEPGTTRAVLNATQSFDVGGGWIMRYKWTFLSVLGNPSILPPEPQILDVWSALTMVSGLSSGYTYQFQVAVQDNDYAEDIALQNITVKQVEAYYALQVSPTYLTYRDELSVSVAMIDSAGLPVTAEHSPCSIELSYEDIEARNAEHYMAYFQVLRFGSKQNIVLGIPAFLLLPDEDVVPGTGTSYSFGVRISNGTEAFPFSMSLSKDSLAIVKIGDAQVTTASNDIISFAYAVNLTLQECIPLLFTFKESVASILDVLRQDILLGKPRQAMQSKRRALAERVAIPVKILTKRGQGQHLLQRLQLANITEAIGSAMTKEHRLGRGNLQRLTLSSRYEHVYCFTT